MTYLLTLAIAVCLAASTSAFFLSPSIYSNPPANRTICQSFSRDQANVALNAARSPYLTCANDGKLKISRCQLRLATLASCPLNFPGATNSPGFPNSPAPILPGQTLIDTDCTTALKTL